MPKIFFTDLRRNDAKKAAKYAEQQMKAGEYTPELAQMLLMLQDNHKELVKMLDKLNAKK